MFAFQLTELDLFRKIGKLEIRLQNGELFVILV